MLEFDKVMATDEEVATLLYKEYERQNNCIELIASENIPSEAVLQAQSSYHALKYAEGYPNARYYAGCENIDAIETLAIQRACELFHCKFANVQPHSGTQANMAVQFALLQPGDTLMGMSLNSGGHLTHGAKPTFSGQYFHSVQYNVNAGHHYKIDYSNLEEMITAVRPNLFIAGASAYPFKIDYAQIRTIIDNVQKTTDHKIWFMVDMAHIAGLVAADLHQSPLPYADVVTTTTHKTLRGPRGGLILWNNEELTNVINKAVFPGVQGGPLEHIIAAKAVCFKEAMTPGFRRYQYAVVTNAQRLVRTLLRLGVKIIGSGTDTHMILLNLRNTGINGAILEQRLAQLNIITNKNAIPGDTASKMAPSGLRIGTPAVTARGMGIKEMDAIATIIAMCIYKYNDQNIQKCQAIVKNLTATFPLSAIEE